MRVLSVFGTRPEAVKMCPLVKLLSQSDKIESLVCITAQHRQMLDQVLNIFNIVPDCDLNIMQTAQTLTGISIGILQGMEKVLLDCRPDLVLVHGDTSTSAMAALAAFYQQVPVGHVEAGLRTYNKYSPFPEEVNRQIISRIAQIHFAPTELNKANLKSEGIENGVYVTGNTVIDAFATTIRPNYLYKNPTLQILSKKDAKIILLTAHRRENIGKPLENICLAVKALSEKYRDYNIIYPLHLNPNVRKTACAILSGLPNVYLLEPLDVEDMHNIMAKAHFVMTDSGGLQEEAPSLGKPVIVLRTETERPEAVAAGTVIVAGVEKQRIIDIASKLIDDEACYAAMAHAVNPYGDGQASRRIVNICSQEGILNQTRHSHLKEE